MAVTVPLADNEGVAEGDGVVVPLTVAVGDAVPLTVAVGDAVLVPLGVKVTLLVCELVIVCVPVLEGVLD